MYNDHKVKLLQIMLSKISTFAKSYDGQTKWMYFLIGNDNLLQKYSTIWDKISTDKKKDIIANLSITKHF